MMSHIRIWVGSAWITLSHVLIILGRAKIQRRRWRPTRRPCDELCPLSTAIVYWLLNLAFIIYELCPPLLLRGVRNLPRGTCGEQGVGG